MELKQFDQFVLVPALNIVGLYSPNAHVLMLGTGAIESNYAKLQSFHGCPGMGFFNIHDSTYNEIYKYLNRHENRQLKETCLSSCLYTSWPNKSCLVYNLRWSVIVAILKYQMTNKPFPNHDNAENLAHFYKKYFCFDKDKIDLEHCTKVFQDVIQHHR